jgi:glutathione S-transferase
MEPLLVYGFPLGSSMGLVASLEWLGQPYRLSRVDMLTEMKNDAYARINGRLETPVLVTNDGRVLTETMAIALWLESRDIERRISFDSGTAKADRMHQLMAFLNTGFTGAFTPFWVALEMSPPDAVLQETLRAYGRKHVIERHDRLEAMIGDTRFLIDDHPTLADGVLLGVARWLDFHEIAKPTRWPRLAALRQRIEAEPAVQFANSIELGEQPTRSDAFVGHVSLSEVIKTFGI